MAGTIDELLPDHGPEAARQALRAGSLLLAFEGPTTRLAGAEPRRWPTRRRVAGFPAVVAAVVILATVSPQVPSSTGSWPQLGTLMTRHPEITSAGLARLDVWTAELAERAAHAQPCTDSTAPTSPDVSSDRSASEVT
jgi:hypothetical protein